jgi:hypothetical protein
MKNFNPLDIGWFLHGTSGAVAGGAFFALPAAVILWAPSWLYMTGENLAWIAAIFYCRPFHNHGGSGGSDLEPRRMV